MATATYQTLSKPRKNLLVKSWFFTGMALAMLAVAVAGFLPSIVQTAGRRAPLPPLVAAHGILFFAWLTIFLVQSRLVATGYVALHQRVGIAAGFALALMIPVGFATLYFRSVTCSCSRCWRQLQSLIGAGQRSTNA
jgi:hypothetical protein